MAFKYLNNKKGSAERREPYRGAAAADPYCRNHGGCPWCEGNRTFSKRKRETVAKEKLAEYEALSYGKTGNNT